MLVRSGWDTHWGTDRYGQPDHPFLTGAAARHLGEAGAALVGIDSVNIDDTSEASGGERPAHTALLQRGIPVLEHLCGPRPAARRPLPAVRGPTDDPQDGHLPRARLRHRRWLTPARREGRSGRLTRQGVREPGRWTWVARQMDPLVPSRSRRARAWSGSRAATSRWGRRTSTRRSDRCAAWPSMGSGSTSTR